MIRSLQKWMSVVKDLVTRTSEQKPVYVISYRVPQTFDILYVYVVHGLTPQYKLILDPANGKVLHQKFIDKLFTNRTPLDELASGLHDKAITKFIGAPFDGKEVTKQ